MQRKIIVTLRIHHILHIQNLYFEQQLLFGFYKETYTHILCEKIVKSNRFSIKRIIMLASGRHFKVRLKACKIIAKYTRHVQLMKIIQQCRYLAIANTKYHSLWTSNMDVVLCMYQNSKQTLTCCITPDKRFLQHFYINTHTTIEANNIFIWKIEVFIKIPHKS